MENLFENDRWETEASFATFYNVQSTVFNTDQFLR